MPKIRTLNKAHEGFFNILFQLSDRDLYILKLLNIERKTFEEVAQILSITPERVRQLERQSIEILDKYL